jgi:peptidoglycan/LPS O-acetylase OafA/YrhL
VTTLPVLGVKRSGTSKRAEHLAFVDGLRGAAIFIVLLSHYYLKTRTLGLPRWGTILGLGYVGVHLFLLLSGFCISWAYLGTIPRPFRAREFVVRRATRILPAYYAVLLLASLLAERRLSGPSLAWQVATHVTMTHNFFRETVLALDAPFWSLALESQLYVAFPFLLLGFRRLGPGVMLPLVLACQTLFRLKVLTLGTGYTDTTFILPWGVAGRLFEFALGMWAARLVSEAAVPKSWLLVWPTLAAFLGATLSKSQLGVTHPLTDFLWSVGFFCLFLGAAEKRSLLQRAFSMKPLVRLGVISYSVYLTHDLVLGPFVTALMGITRHKVSALALAPIALGLTILVGSGCYVLVERPAIAFFRRRAAQPSGAA